MSNISANSKYIAIAILIGGKSTRFGSDKGLFPLFGKPLISYQLDTLSQLNYNIFLVAHSNQQVQKYIDNIDFTCLSGFIIDDQNFHEEKHLYAPLIGLLSTFKELRNLKYAKVLVISCDSPMIKKEVLQYLVVESKDYDCSIPQWNNGFLEPLLAIYTNDKALKTAKESIRTNSYKLTNLLSKQWKINFISIEKSLKPIDKDLNSFININGPKDLEKIKSIIKNSEFK